ncbi:MAG TPA: pyruvate kinase [Flavobacteriales bacterium]|nr:pyruvate kinase [Flavobacteriales bacterium]
MKKTKIVATVGPASQSPEILRQLMIEGVNVFRLNASHGKHDIHRDVIKHVRAISKELQRSAGILVDLQGPKLRIGEVENNSVYLANESQLIFTNEPCMGNAEKVYMTYKDFAKDVKRGDRILIDDGKIALECISTNGVNEVIARVVHGGVLSSKKGVNLPNTKVSLPSLTPKDIEDLDFALENNVDWIGLSFVRSARDIIELRAYIQNKHKAARIVAKIEKPEAIDDIDDIITETDAIMIARGDLGVEIPLENVPIIQKMLIKKCTRNAKPVIVATQMMESMITNIFPTRAEVNDVANAVLDGADAVMLSGETSVGEDPVNVIQTMCKIINAVESTDEIYFKETIPDDKRDDRFISDSICFNATRLAQRVGATAIITMTHSGYTAFKVSSQRPKASTFVATGNVQLLNIMSLVWGVEGVYYDKMVSTDHTIADIKYLLKKKGWVQPGDLVINIASMPIEEKGKSNMLKLSEVG